MYYNKLPKSRQMRQASRVLLSIYFEIFRFLFLYLESLKVLENYRSLKVFRKLEKSKSF